MRLDTARSSETTWHHRITSNVTWVVSYVNHRFRISFNGPVVALTFLCPYLIYSRLGRDTAINPARAALGVVTYLLLFLELRLTDDLDDYEPGHQGDERAGASRSQLRILLAATATLTVVLNGGSLLAVITVLAAAAAITGPPVFKRTAAARTPVLVACYEAGPLILAVYPYVAWRATHATAGARLIISASGLVWGLYEYWKFSRSHNRGAARPHGLSPGAARAVMLVLLSGIFGCWVSVFMITRDPLPSLIFALAVCSLPAWLLWRGRGDRYLPWSGLIVAGALEAYAVITMLIAN